MALIKLFGEKEPPSINFASLISLKSISDISIYAHRNIFDHNEYRFCGVITFQHNGDEFKKELSGVSLSDVFLKVYNFCQSL